MRVGYRELECRRDLIRMGKALQRQGFVAGTSGNLSVRLDADRVLITPTGVNKGMMVPDDIVVVNSSGERLSGWRAPSSEIGLHLTIYRLRDDVHAIVHAHPCVATAFACAGLALDEPLCSEIVLTLGQVPLAPYGTPGSNELSQNVAPFIPDYDAILMANHGVVSYGHDLLTAYLNMDIVEHFAAITLKVCQLGKRKLLDPFWVEELSRIRTKANAKAIQVSCGSTRALDPALASSRERRPGSKQTFDRWPPECA